MAQRTFRNQQKKKGKKNVFLAYLGIALVIFIIIGILIFSYIGKDLPSLSKIENKENIKPSKIYDRTGEILLYELKGDKEKILVPLSEISTFAQKATLASEDTNFYNHFGISPKSILRAVLNNIAVRIGLEKERQIIEGGSTITQQTIKISLLTPERTLLRKIKEAILSIELELRYSKDQILELYLNQIPYGSSAYGIESASRLYFGKSAKDLNLSESAILAALIKSPSRLSPYGSHLDELFARQIYILDKMESLGFITKEEKESAKKYIPKFTSKFTGIKAPHFVMYVRDLLEQTYGTDYLKNGGFKIYTTLDWRLQQISEDVIKTGVKNNEKSQAYNGSLVSIDPKTGQILSMVGSKDYFSTSYPENCSSGKDCLFDPNVNVSTRDRQPGSTFKPFVYAKAFQKGYTPETILFDVQTEFNPNCPADSSKEKNDSGGDCYHPKNYDGNFRGPVNLRNSIAQSLNIPSVKLLYLSGVSDSISLAKQMGITTLNQPSAYYGLSLVLGGGEVKLLDMVSSFGVFAANGVANQKTAILKIEDEKGKILEEFKPRPQVVMEEQTASLINDVLSDNKARSPMFGENSPLFLGERPAAAKTGTSQDYRDAWTIGYTPSLVCGVWTGNNNNSPIDKKAGGYAAAPIWNEFMKRAYQLTSTGKINEFSLPTETEEFKKPEAITTNKPILNGDFIEKSIVKIDKISKKLAGPLTPLDLIEEKSFSQIHSILRYVDKNDPQGPLPDSSTPDTQYNNWEEGIKIWLKSSGSEILKNLSIEMPPQDYDNIHTEENIPRIEIRTPPPQSTFFLGSTIKINIFVKAPLGISRINYFLGNNLLNSKVFLTGFDEQEKVIEDLLFIPQGLLNETSLKVEVIDSAKNKSEKEIPVYIK